jgi:hypothetical protein
MPRRRWSLLTERLPNGIFGLLDGVGADVDVFETDSGGPMGQPGVTCNDCSEAV